jgi:hypothetical protein
LINFAPIVQNQQSPLKKLGCTVGNGAAMEVLVHNRWINGQCEIAAKRKLPIDQRLMEF